MKTLAFCALLATVSVGASTIQDMPESPKPTAEHQWLQQMVGEWDCKTECSMGPGTPTQKFESTERVRSMGGLWVVGEGSAVMDGKPFSSLLTLGYDPLKKAFVGSWACTEMAHLWVYRGSLDDAKKKLTLEADGPNFMDPTKTCHFHDVIEIVDADHRVLTSSALGEDGTWTQFMRAEYRRKAAR